MAPSPFFLQLPACCAARTRPHALAGHGSDGCAALPETAFAGHDRCAIDEALNGSPGREAPVSAQRFPRQRIRQCGEAASRARRDELLGGSNMTIGVIAWELEVFGCQSLKEKRSVIKSLKDRLHERFNVSVAETGHQDVWQRAELTACVVAGDKRHAESVLASADQLVASEARARVIDTYRTFR